MFGTLDLSGNPEVMLWRQYSQSLGVVHNVVVMAQHGNYGRGITRGMVDAFPMANGLPIYANGAGYHGDKTIADVRRDRDPRLYVMLKEPGDEKNMCLSPIPQVTMLNRLSLILLFWTPTQNATIPQDTHSAKATILTRSSVRTARTIPLAPRVP